LTETRDSPSESRATQIAARRAPRHGPALLLAGFGVLVLAVVSLFVGVGDLGPLDLFEAGEQQHEAMLLMVSRVPRTLAIILSGMSISVAGLLMQMLSRNRFVEPSTAGTVEFASLGLLIVTLFAPGATLLLKMLVASGFALVGTAVFLGILRSIKTRSSLIVPLIGLMLGGVVASITTFFAYRHDLLQTLGTWMLGDFSGVLQGRYELLWVVLGLTALAYFAADRFTVAGMGSEVSATLGMSHGRVMTLGLTIVSLVTAIVVVTVGSIPFLGLVVPNIAALLVGDNLRRTIPWVAILGAGFVLACDLVGRLVRYPYEIPIGAVVGVVGSALFLFLLLRSADHAD